MKRAMPEFLAIPVVLVVLGVIAVILLAADAGVAAWLVVGVFTLVVLIVGAVVVMRRPRPAGVSEGSSRFEGGAAPARDDIHRVLLVVDDMCTPGDLRGLADAHGGNRTAVFIVAPAVGSRISRLTGDEDAYAKAQGHLDDTVQALTNLGFDARGHLGSHDPLQATDEALREFPADEIVFVLHGGDETAWLERGVVGLARDRYSVSVSELELSKTA